MGKKGGLTTREMVKTGLREYEWKMKCVRIESNVKWL